MQIRKRLKAIASLVPKGAKVIDIGCDHALLDVYLTLYNQNKCIASDVNKNAYEIAKSNIKKYNLDEIKDLPSKSLKDPKISLKLNPNIKSENVSYAKRKTKFLRKTR